MERNSSSRDHVHDYLAIDQPGRDGLMNTDREHASKRVTAAILAKPMTRFV